MSRREVAEGFGGRLDLGARPGLVVVDLSLAFTDPASPLACDVGAALPATGGLVQAARSASVPVAFTTIAFRRDLSDGGAWLRKIPGMALMVEGSRWSEVDPGLGLRPGDKLIRKRGASGFHGTDLADWLRSQEVDCVIVTGASTSGCVRATAVDAVQEGWPTFVVSDCVADRDERAHEAALYDLDAKYADVVALPPVLAHLSHLATRESP